MKKLKKLTLIRETLDLLAVAGTDMQIDYKTDAKASSCQSAKSAEGVACD